MHKTGSPSSMRCRMLPSEKDSFCRFMFFGARYFAMEENTASTEIIPFDKIAEFLNANLR